MLSHGLSVIGWLFTVLAFAAFVVEAWAFGDAISRPSKAFPAAGKAFVGRLIASPNAQASTTKAANASTVKNNSSADNPPESTVVAYPFWRGCEPCRDLELALLLAVLPPEELPPEELPPEEPVDLLPVLPEEDLAAAPEPLPAALLPAPPEAVFPAAPVPVPVD